MADDNIVRSYRSSGPARRVNAPAESRDAESTDSASGDDATRSDPLAELARLIGQSDPFADSGQNGGQDRGRNSAQAAAARPQGEFAASDWRRTAAALARESMRSPPLADPRHEEADPALSAADPYRTAPDDRFAQPARHATLDDERDASTRYRDEPHFSEDGEEPRNAPPAEAQQAGDENYFFDGEVQADDRFYDDPPRVRRGNGLITAVVLVGCAMLGTAGAYGYRTYYTGTRPADAPIISADPTPSKLVPAAATADAQAGKSGERVTNERIVPRQEEPVTLPDANNPRVVQPAFTSPPGAKPPSPQAAQAAAVPGNLSTEPKKIRTVAIKPDGSDAVARPLSNPGSPPTQVSAALPPATTHPASKPVPQPARNNGGPLSLEPRPQAGDAAASSYQPAVREYAAAPPPTAPRLASASAAATGAYVVQISSQKSETDAQASIRSLQAKYPKELGDRDATVRRADLGPTMGVVYRVMVGPFGSKSEADQFCSGYKAAGGQCIVPKN
jgi:hypothetical protein